MQNDESELATLKSAPCSHDFSAGWKCSSKKVVAASWLHIDILGVWSMLRLDLLVFGVGVAAENPNLIIEAEEDKQKLSPPICCPVFVSLAEWSSCPEPPRHSGRWSWLWDRTGRGRAGRMWRRGSGRSLDRPLTRYCGERERKHLSRPQTC